MSPNSDLIRMACLQEAEVITLGNCVLLPQGLKDTDFVKELSCESISKAYITM